MMTVGVIGGMGPAATVDFLRRLIEATPASRDQDHIRVLVDSNPAVPDRTAAILGDGPDPSPHLVAMARRLERWGADLLVMPCNTAHAYAHRITAAVGVPLVPWPAVVADAILAVEPGPVGLLATRGTVAAGVYQEAVERRGATLVVPDWAVQERISAAIVHVKRDGPAAPAARAELAEAATTLLVQGATALLLGCTELSAIAGTPSADGALQLAPTWDAAQIVAEHVVAEALVG